jgi:hypothetical protein
VLKRFFTVLAVIFAGVFAFGGVASAGNAHYVGDPTVSRAGDTLTVSGKLAGLGNEPQVHVVVTATAACVNPGGNNPQAANKQTITAEGSFPVQNGKALFSLNLAAVFQPSCSPPMSVVFSDVTVTAADLQPLVVPGTF